MDPESATRLLQFADGLFPAGGHAHSFGLESYVQAGMIRDRAGVEAFLHNHLEGSLGPCDAVAVAFALALGRAGDLESCLDLDRTLEAMKHVREFREASRQMGHQTIRVASALTGAPMLRDFLTATEAGETPGHHPVVFGLTGSTLQWSAEAAAVAYLYSSSALLVGAAMRLLPLGQLDGQRLLWGAGPLITRLAREAAERDPSHFSGQMWSFAPGIEIAGMGHAMLESRLFRS